MSSLPEKSVIILPEKQLTFSTMKKTPDIASATVSIYNPTSDPVLYKIKGNKGALNCTASTGTIEPNCFADVTVVVKKGGDGKFPDGIKIMVVTAPYTRDVKQLDPKEAWKEVGQDVRSCKELQTAYRSNKGEKTPFGKVVSDKKGTDDDSKKLRMNPVVDLSSSMVQEEPDPMDDKVEEEEDCEDCTCEKHKVFIMILLIGMILVVAEYYFGICT